MSRCRFGGLGLDVWIAVVDEAFLSQGRVLAILKVKLE